MLGSVEDNHCCLGELIISTEVCRLEHLSTPGHFLSFPNFDYKGLWGSPSHNGISTTQTMIHNNYYVVKVWDVSRLRHSPPIALNKEDPTGGELPIGEFLLLNRSVP